MRKKKKKKKLDRGTLIFCAIIFSLFIYKFISVEIQYNKLVNEKERLMLQLSQEKDKLEQLDSELTQMGTDEYIEMLARKYFGLVYPSEKVFIEVNPD